MTYYVITDVIMSRCDVVTRRHQSKEEVVLPDLELEKELLKRGITWELDGKWLKLYDVI